MKEGHVCSHLFSSWRNAPKPWLPIHNQSPQIFSWFTLLASLTLVQSIDNHQKDLCKLQESRLASLYTVYEGKASKLKCRWFSIPKSFSLSSSISPSKPVKSTYHKDIDWNMIKFISTITHFMNLKKTTRVESFTISRNQKPNPNSDYCHHQPVY